MARQILMTNPNQQPENNMAEQMGNSELVESFASLLRFAESRICTHEETHRGGILWEICDGCGAKWADDEGGKPEFKWPDPIIKAQQALHSLQAANDPVLYQRRMRPTWDDKHPWSNWEGCPKGCYEDYISVPVQNGWEYQTRALYTSPTVKQSLTVPEGYRLVPVDPTEQMLVAARYASTCPESASPADDEHIARCEALLASTPIRPQQAPDEPRPYWMDEGGDDHEQPADEGEER